jgi:hypothetical protein
MQRPSIDIARVAIAVLILGCSGSVRRSLAWSEPPSVAPADASAYVGQEVRMAGFVASAEVRDGRAVLVLDDRSGAEFPVVIAPPLIGPRPAELVERFRGREVEAQGRIDDLGGPLEMLVGDPEQVRLAVAAAGAPSTDGELARSTAPAATVAETRPVPAVDAPPPAVSARSATAQPVPVAAPPRSAAESPSVPAEARPSRPTAATAERAVGAPAESRQSTATASPPVAASAAADDARAACERARAKWRDAAASARAPLARFEQCLATKQPPCRRESDALREALAEVAAAEERVAWLCPREP